MRQLWAVTITVPDSCQTPIDQRRYLCHSLKDLGFQHCSVADFLEGKSCERLFCWLWHSFMGLPGLSLTFPRSVESPPIQPAPSLRMLKSRCSISSATSRVSP